MVKTRSANGRVRGRALGARATGRRRAAKRRLLRLEALENRALLATYNYPFGAMPDDTGEYLLGDVAVNVVLMESDPALAPYDNNPPTDPLKPGRGFLAENWTTEAIAAVKQNVQTGLQWWKSTLANVFPLAPAGLLDFQINWQYADNPVHTGFEPIARKSNDFAQDSFDPFGTSQGWIYDFLREVGFAATGNFSTDIRAYNNFTRQQAGADWAFTIFVVNNANDADKMFDLSGSFAQAFSYAGGRFMVVPASRPPSTIAHEAGHQFWALDQYLGGGTYSSQRGYYNTQNLNAADNPAPGFVQADSIMANGTKLANAYANLTSDLNTLASVGWQDTDNDGIFDVLDVPLTLSGSGQYNASTGMYTFTGSTKVNTLPNRNSSGLQNDITINQVRVVQASVDDGPWQNVQTFDPRTYQANVTVNVPVPPTGLHTVKIRSADTRTGVISNVFVGETDGPTSGGPLATGVVFRDDNRNAAWDNGEPPISDFGLTVLDQSDIPIDLQRYVEPNDWAQGTVLNSIEPGATLSAVGGGVSSADVTARTSTIATSAGKVFSPTDSNGTPQQTWNGARRLRVDFASPVSTVSLRAYSGAPGSTSVFGRLEAYTTDGTLIARDTTGLLSTASFATLNVSRAQGDIAYVIAYGHLGSSVILDTLQWGPAASATTNSSGGYSLAYLPDGTYRVKAVAPAGYFVTTPVGGVAVVTVAGGQMSGAADFGIATVGPLRFHNYANPFNVDNDAGNNVSAGDALMIINYINAHTGSGGAIVPTDDPAIIGYIDVDGDNNSVAGDALMVINYINANPRPPGGGEGETPAVSASPRYAAPWAAPPGQGEGETAINVPRNAAEYYAQQPLHLLNIRGTTEPCSCGECVATRGAAADRALQDLSPAASSAAELLGSLLPAERPAAARGEQRSRLDTPPLLVSMSAAAGALPRLARTLSKVQELPAAKVETALDEIAPDVAEALAAGPLAAWAKRLK